MLDDLADPLRATGYAVKVTPFGWLCQGSLDVFGESMAKVFQDIGPSG